MPSLASNKEQRMTNKAGQPGEALRPSRLDSETVIPILADAGQQAVAVNPELAARVPTNEEIVDKIINEGD